MYAMMAAHAAAAFLIMLITIAFIGKRYGYFRIEYDHRYCSTILKEGMAFVFTAAFVVMYFKIDSVMLSLMKGDDAVGYYTAAYNIIIAFMVFPAIMAKVIYPSLSKDYFRSQEAYRGLLKKTLLFAVLLGAASVVGVCLFARSIILLLYGAAFVGAVGPLRILSLTFLLICITTVAGTALNAGNKQKALALTTGAGVVINVVFNALLIPPYGTNGAAAATCLTQVFYALVLFSVLFNKNIRQGARA